MATVARSWMRTFCTRCSARQVFVLQPGWVLVCETCGEQRRLAENGLLAHAPAA